jgi:hypothetical protein
MENQLRLNSESTIDNDIFNLKIGTTNRLTPQVVYLEGRTFISPLESQESYRKEISSIELGFRRLLNERLGKNSFFSPKYIMDFQVANSGLKPGKMSFLSFELLVKQCGKDLYKLKEVKEGNIGFIQETMADFSDIIKSNGFVMSKTKKPSKE